MKKTISLLGLLFAGVAVLANPATGVVAATTPESDVVAADIATTTTLSGDPPATTTEDVVVDTETTTAVVTTTTTEADNGTYSVVGSEEESRFGTFQVEVYFEDGEIVAIETLQAPTDRKSQSINGRAIPSYEAAIIAAQSTDIDAMSGATITWQNYTASVQAALDEAGLPA